LTGDESSSLDAALLNVDGVVFDFFIVRIAHLLLIEQVAFFSAPFRSSSPSLKSPVQDVFRVPTVDVFPVVRATHDGVRSDFALPVR
jgi:hypothetical protein